MPELIYTVTLLGLPIIGVGIELPDLPYFTGDPVFQPRSPASRKEAVREIESPVLDYTNHLCSEPSGKSHQLLIASCKIHMQ